MGLNPTSLHLVVFTGNLIEPNNLNPEPNRSSLSVFTPPCTTLTDATWGSWIGLTKERAQPVIIVESGPEVVAPCPAGILAKLHVQDPMLLIFDAPMTADDGGKSVTLYQRAQEVAVFRTRFC